MEVYPVGGYKTISLNQLANGVSELLSKRISFAAFRMYLASFEIVARREAARRLGGAESSFKPVYEVEEWQKLCVCANSRAARKALRELNKASIGVFDKSNITHRDTPTEGARELLSKLCPSRSGARLIPVPRRLIRFMAASGSRAEVLTLLGYIMRGLSLHRRGEVRGVGRAKLSLLAEVMNISRASAQRARATLIGHCIISPDSTENQWVLNKHGAHFEINLEWGVDNPQHTQMSPQAPKNNIQMRPPYRDKRTLNRLETREPSSSVCVRQLERGKGGEAKLRKPNIHAVVNEDLWRISRMQALYEQAIKARLVKSSQASRLAFFAAAIRARNLDNAPKIFSGIIRKGLWHHITQAEEDLALRALKRAA